MGATPFFSSLNQWPMFICSISARQNCSFAFSNPTRGQGYRSSGGTCSSLAEFSSILSKLYRNLVQLSFNFPRYAKCLQTLSPSWGPAQYIQIALHSTRRAHTPCGLSTTTLGWHSLCLTPWWKNDPAVSATVSRTVTGLGAAMFKALKRVRVALPTLCNPYLYRTPSLSILPNLFHNDSC